MTKQPLEKIVHVRITEDEDLALDNLAQVYGEQNRSRILRKMIREATQQGPELLKDDVNAFREAVRELAAVGRNVNQIAYALNAGRMPNCPLDIQLLNSVDDRITKLKSELLAIVTRTHDRWIKRG